MIINTPVVVYETDSGRLLGAYTPNSFSTEFMQEGLSYLNNLTPTSIYREYILNNELILRPEYDPSQWTNTTITADGVDEWVLTGLPMGTTVRWWDGTVETIDDGSLEFSVDTPGEYQFIVEGFPFLPKEFTIEATV